MTEKKHPILKTILLIIVAYLVITFFIDLIGRNMKKKTKDPTPVVTEDLSYAARKKAVKELKKEKSDIKGMTKYDKYKMGLSTKDGSDTDGDGLTDKEEIEVYNSDPKKMSSAGDLYTDGEKVKMGLDPNEKKSYEGKLTYKNNFSDGAVKLYAKTAYGRFAIVNAITGFDSLDGRDVYAEYQLSHFDGRFAIN
ncbi:MAG: thrombospondin type 3 repeat-containing protein, partial [Candidatus Weimeria sp.]